MNLQRVAEYLAVLTENAGFSEIGAAAMFELGGFYYYENHGFSKDFGKGTNIGSYLSCSFDYQDTCYRLAVHYYKIDPEIFNGRFHFEKAAILGSAKARFILGSDAHKFEVRMKPLNLTIAAK